MNHILYINFLNYAIQALIMILFLMNMLTPRIKGSYTVIIFVLCILGDAALFINVTENIPLKMIISSGVLISLILLLFKEKIMVKFFIFMLLIVMLYIAESVTFYLLKALHSGDIKTMGNFSEMRIVALTYFNIVAFGLTMLIILAMRKFKFKIRVENLVIFTFFPVSQAMLLGGFIYSYIVYNDLLFLNIGVTGILLSVIADFILLNTINATSEKLIAEEKLSFMETKLKLENSYYELMQYHIKELEMKRHDYKNQLQVIYGLLAMDDDSSRAYAKKMLDMSSEDIAAERSISYCAHPLVNTIMVVKAKHANALDIDTDIKVDIPDNIDIQDIDLSSLLLNLFDNAIEACGRINTTAIKKHICIKASCMANYLVIKINNTTSESRDGRVSDLPGSAKENSKGHGYGLKIIDRIVSKYDGNLDMKIEAGEFITKVALKVNRQNADEADMIEV